MSKWRPSLSGCLYVIPDLHGSVNILNKICTRILPLRKINNIKDKIIFLGDYIDRHIDSHLVLDKLIEIKNKYNENVIFLLGNHEIIMLNALGIKYSYNIKSLLTRENAYRNWLYNGGYQTISGYIERSNVRCSLSDLTIDRVYDLIPKEHINFLLDLKPVYETNEYIFAHAAYDISKSINDQSVDILINDRLLFNNIKNGLLKPYWDKTIICGHSHVGPIIHDKYMMLDCGAPRQLLFTELNSMSAFLVYSDKSRMIPITLKETIIQ